MKESSWSWIEEAATEEQSDEALAQDGDEDLSALSSDWGLSSNTKEKCCRCKSGSIGWSASGRCSFCHGYVAKTASVASECQKSSPKFIGNHACAAACKSKVKESSWSWIEESAAEEQSDEALAQDGDEDLSALSSDWGLSSNTKEKCCRCKSGSIGWSASGRCSFCHGYVAKTASVASECQKSSPKFIGNHACAAACKSKVKESSWSWIEEAATEEQSDEALAQDGDEDLSALSSDWGLSSNTKEKCCRCKSGSIGWSASGRCSFCHGYVAKTASVASECQKSSPKFIGNHACAAACKSKVKESSWSWIEEAATEEQSDEALAQDGDEDLSALSSDWGLSSNTKEKCCRCKSGSIGWSASGRCSFCHGYVAKTASVARECQKSSPKFIGNHACAAACKSKVKESSWSWIQSADEDLSLA